MKRLLCVALALLLLLFTALPAAAAGYQRGKLTVVSEPEAFSSDDVTYWIGDEVASPDQLEWVDGGRDGKALRLSGNGGFLRLSHTVARVPRFTISLWVNRQGDAPNQRLFTIARSDTNYITFSPNYQNTALTRDGGFANGVYLRYQFGGQNGRVLDMFNPTSADVSYALPLNEWHHVALVADGQTVKLYIDGVRWFEEQVLTSLFEMQAHSLDIGTGEWGDATLDALLDNVELYNSALSEEAVRALAGAAEATEPYLPTAPTTLPTTVPTTTASTATATARQTLSPTLFGVPMFGVYIILGVVAAYVVITVAVNVARKREGDK